MTQPITLISIDDSIPTHKSHNYVHKELVKVM